ITTYLYVTIQIFKLSAEEAIDDPVKGAASGSSLQLISVEVIFSALGCLMLGMLLYTILTYGSPFNKEILTP
ncbi:Major facilitator superfamily domain-containing protein 2B, partial [Bienertia sinuspersici]